MQAAVHRMGQLIDDPLTLSRVNRKSWSDGQSTLSQLATQSAKNCTSRSLIGPSTSGFAPPQVEVTQA